MKISCYAMSSRQTHQIDTAKKFVSGLKRHNINANLEIGFKGDNESDLVLVWGMRGARIVRPGLNTDGDHILLTTQIKGDNSINHLDVNYQKIINDIKANTDLPVYVRDHPHRRMTWGVFEKDGIADSNIPIAEACAKAKVVVTINSNSGVDATLAGTPVVNFDNGSMVWDLAMKDLSQLNNPPTPDRTQWCNNTAYAQWLPYEIENGDAWDHLKQRYD